MSDKEEEEGERGMDNGAGGRQTERRMKGNEVGGGQMKREGRKGGIGEEGRDRGRREG